MTIAVGDIIRLNAVGSVFGQRIMLTLPYGVQQITGPQPEADVCNELLNEVRGGGGGDLFESLYLSCLPVDYQLVKWVAQKTNPIRYAYVKVNRNTPGTHAGACEETNLAAVITMSGYLAGRDQIANKHIGPLPGGATVRADGELVIAYKALLDTLGTALASTVLLPGTGVTLAPCIPHAAAPGTYSTIADNETQDTIRVMRRRTVRVGE